MVGLDAAGVYQPGDLLGDDAGLAATGAGQYQQGAIDIVHGLALSGVESGHFFSDRGAGSRGRSLAKTTGGQRVESDPDAPYFSCCQGANYSSLLPAQPSTFDGKQRYH